VEESNESIEIIAQDTESVLENTQSVEMTEDSFTHEDTDITDAYHSAEAFSDTTNTAHNRIEAPEISIGDNYEIH